MTGRGPAQPQVQGLRFALEDRGAGAARLQSDDCGRERSGPYRVGRSWSSVGSRSCWRDQRGWQVRRTGVEWGGGPAAFGFTCLAFHYPAEAPLDRGRVMISP